MAVSAAQAADLPVKAAPVAYVKVCNIFCAGLWYVPGTGRCRKIDLHRVEQDLQWIRDEF